jgi:hypothetical protein
VILRPIAAGPPLRVHRAAGWVYLVCATCRTAGPFEHAVEALSVADIAHAGGCRVAQALSVAAAPRFRRRRLRLAAAAA